ncbi:MAG: rhombotarget lipoprotein, partial [Mariprofundaceae bacterium]
MSVYRVGIIFFCAVLISGCASWFSGYPFNSEKRSASSVVDYLYPDSEPPKHDPETVVTTLKLPVRVGIAFVPKQGRADTELPEETRMRLLEQVKASFEPYEFVSKIEVLPSAYLRPGGGFANLDQAARMFGVDVMALVSYDQIQFNDANKLSLMYWTIVGAYMFKGDQYDTQTMVDAVVYDVASRKLLFRAPGVSTVKGSSTLVNYQERARAARIQGFEEAVTSMIPSLDKELAAFKESVKTDASVQVVHRDGYSGGGGMGLLGLAAALG